MKQPTRIRIFCWAGLLLFLAGCLAPYIRMNTIPYEGAIRIVTAPGTLTGISLGLVYVSVVGLGITAFCLATTVAINKPERRKRAAKTIFFFYLLLANVVLIVGSHFDTEQIDGEYIFQSVRPAYGLFLYLLSGLSYFLADFKFLE